MVVRMGMGTYAHAGLQAAIPYLVADPAIRMNSAVQGLFHWGRQPGLDQVCAFHAAEQPHQSCSVGSAVMQDRQNMLRDPCR